MTEKDSGSVNSGNPDNSNGSKLKDRSKKSKPYTRKYHSSSKSYSSRKSKSSQKTGNRKRKESRGTRDRKSSSENLSNYSHGHIKECSDDELSAVSDNRCLLTRSRIRRIERRKAYSSNSSALESDHRKTKSEPIIITLDSESEDNLSLVSNRPNRSARIRGELIRKLSGTTTTKLNVYKTCDSSSSSEYENVKRKKNTKSKSVKTTSSSQTAKRKKYFVNRLACKSRVKLRRHNRPRIPVVYAPSNKRRDLRSIRKRFEVQKTEKQASRLSVKRSSQYPTSERRSLRSTSTDTIVDDNAVKHDNEADNIKREKYNADTALQPEMVNTQPDIKKGYDDINSKKQAKREMDIILPDTKVDCERGQNLKSTSEPKQESIAHTEAEPTNETAMELQNENNVESMPRIKLEPGHTSNVDAELVSNITPNGTESEVQTTKSIPGEEKRDSIARKKIVLDSKLPQKDRRKLKKKLKPGLTVVRKRGRPRLCEAAKPIKHISRLNDLEQIPFLQNSYCFVVAPKLSKCRECRIAVNRSARSMLHAYCRFMEYRKLSYNRNGSILNAGFSEPSEATHEHLNQWLPQLRNPPEDLNLSTSRALIEHIGDQFCDLIEQEKEALSLHIGRDKVITWKRIVQGVREMCDVCYTTLFNIHWVCPVCGLAVCIDCYKGRKQGQTVEFEDEQPKNRDQYNWLVCSAKQPHDPEKLVMAQIIPGSALWNMRDLLHKARREWEIPSYCKCNPHTVITSDIYISSGVCKQLMCSVTKSVPNEYTNCFFSHSSNMQNNESIYEDLDFEVTGSALKWVQGGYAQIRYNDDDGEFSYEEFHSLRGNLLNGMNGEYIDTFEQEREITCYTIDDVIECVKQSHKKENSGKNIMKHFSNRYPQANSGRDPLPIRIYTKMESDLMFPAVPHSWFCNGRLLFLLQPNHSDNLGLFQEQWKRGQPIVVRGVDQSLSQELWHPDAFCRDFGDVRNDLVDCRTGAVIKNLPMKRFWEGFESFTKRLKDDDGEYMLLKLKDWPPGEDFSEMLPKRFNDLMEGLPLPEYTHRNGILNLAGRLPSWFVRPDLGPKMYNAYGSALFPAKGTTNLHLDISDAVNVMVYVGIPEDGNTDLHVEEALKAIDEGGCDTLMRARVRCRGSKPGALWHIYNARDADKIRELLNTVAVERGEKLEAHHDPIHDQSWYLDSELRKRLYKDYGVEGYAIAQCLGDAVFIPAGAPHQVRNLHSCVKVAEDFVSPENIAHCFKLTQEFRHLSDTHTNHEDKLQIKNIIYHVVRDALAHLLADHSALQS